VTAVSGRSKPEVAVDRTPNIPTERRTLYWASAAPKRCCLEQW